MNVPRLLSILLLALATLCGAEEKISLLTSGEEPLTLEQLKLLAPGAEVTQQEKGKAPSYTLKWPDSSAKVKYLPQPNRDKPVTLEIVDPNYPFGEVEVNNPHVEEELPPRSWGFFKNIPGFYHTCNITLPDGFDDKGTNTSFIHRLAIHTKGFLSHKEGLYAGQGFLALGEPYSPPFLGITKQNIILLENPQPLEKLILGKWQSTYHYRETGAEQGLTIISQLSGTALFRSNGTTYNLDQINCIYSIDGTDTVRSYQHMFTSNGKWYIKDGLLTTQTFKMEKSAVTSNTPSLAQAIQDAPIDPAQYEPMQFHVLTYEPDTLILQEVGTHYCYTYKRLKEDKEQKEDTE